MPDFVIAVVDGDEAVREATRRLVQSMGFRVEVFSSADDFLRSAHLDATACLLLDMHMPGMTGLELQSYLTSIAPRIPIVFMTALCDETTRTRALKAGALDVL